jgi:predicted kinase
LRYLIENVALERLNWILNCIDNGKLWDTDDNANAAPEFAEIISLDTLAETIRQLSSVYAPVAVVGIDIREHTAKAKIRDQEGGVTILSCTVEPEPPYQIVAISTMDLVPTDLPPRLPMDFREYSLQGNGGGARLIVFSGLPGTGKSTLADAVGRDLHIPVFGADWLLGSLTPFGGYHVERRQEMGAELLTTLALRQLLFGQPAILDFPAEDPIIRKRWRTLAQQTGSDFKVVVCICPDLQVHRMRLKERRRGIPGWHEGGNWPSVERRIARFLPWENDVLTVDTMQSHAANIARVLNYLSDKH